MNMKNTNETTVNLREYVQIVKRRKWYLILAIVAVLSGTIGGSFLLTPIYESTALVRLGQQSILGAAVRRLTPEGSGRLYDSRSRSEKIEALRRRVISSAYLEQLIGRMDWVNKFLAEGGPEAKAAQMTADARRTIILFLVARLQNQIRVNLIGNGYVEIITPSPNPVEAKEAATHLAAIFRENMIREEVAAIRVAGEFSEEQLEIYREKWTEAQTRLAEFKSQKVREAVDDQLETERNLQDIMGEKDAVNLDYANATERIEELQRQLGEEGVARADFVYSERLTTLHGEQLSLINRLGNLLGKYSWKDRGVVDYNYRIGTGLNNIQAEITRIVDETFTNLSATDHDAMIELIYLHNKLGFLTKKKQVMNRIINRIRDRMATGPEYEQQLRRLETEETASRDIYNRFVEQYTGSQILQAQQRAAAESKYTLIESPVVPSRPVYPDRLNFAAAAALIGLVLGFTLVFLAEYNDHSFRDVEEVEEYLGYKVLTTVPRIAALKEARFAGKR